MNTIAQKPGEINPPNTIQRIVNPWVGKVKMLTLTPTHKAGTVKAFASIQIADALEIRDLKLIQQEGQRAWVSLPDHQRSDGKGYAPIVKCLDDRLKAEIDKVVLDAWQSAVGGAA